MSLYRRQTFRTRDPDRGQITERETVYNVGKDAAGDGGVVCSRITLLIRPNGRKELDKFREDCGSLGVRATFTHGIGNQHKKYSLWPLMGYSCSGPAQSLGILSRRDYVHQVGGGFKGRMVEDEALPRPAIQTGYARDGFVNQRREPPVPREARRVVRPDIPNAAGRVNPPVDSKGRRLFDHPAHLASECQEPMPAIGRKVTKATKMTSQVKAGREATLYQVETQYFRERIRKNKIWFPQTVEGE